MENSIFVQCKTRVYKKSKYHYLGIYITSQYNYLGFTFMPSGKKRVGIENLMVCKVK